MMLIRRFEEKAAEAYAIGKIGGFLHLYIGEEAVAVGATSVLRPDDYAVAAYREHGHCLAKGSDPRRAMAELFGRRDGLSKGKGGSMHLFDQSVNFLGGHAIVGSHLPLAAGVGFAIKYQGGDQVIVCYFGDGAVPGGGVPRGHEPRRAVEAPRHLPLREQPLRHGDLPGAGPRRDGDLEVRPAYNMPCEPVDGMDVLAVREVVGARRRCAPARRSAPALIEARTYRFRGHSMRDPAGAVYRTKEEVEQEKLRDPDRALPRPRPRRGRLTEADVRAIEKDVNDRIDEAVAFAEASPEPPAEWLFTDIYKD